MGGTVKQTRARNYSRGCKPCIIWHEFDITYLPTYYTFATYRTAHSPRATDHWLRERKKRKKLVSVPAAPWPSTLVSPHHSWSQISVTDCELIVDSSHWTMTKQIQSFVAWMRVFLKALYAWTSTTSPINIRCSDSIRNVLRCTANVARQIIYNLKHTKSWIWSYYRQSEDPKPYA